MDSNTVVSTPAPDSDLKKAKEEYYKKRAEDERYIRTILLNDYNIC